MTRPVGSIDKKKRKTRTKWIIDDINFVRKYYHQYSLSELSKKLNRPKYSISTLAKELGLKKLGGHRIYSFDEAINNLIFSGVYAIENINNGMLYIGSSYNISNRISNHLNQLNNNKHNNQLLQQHWKEYNNFGIVLLNRCNESEIGTIETKWLKGLDSNALYNYTIYNAHPRLTQKQIEKFWEKIDKQKNGCWIWRGYSNNSNKQYGIIRINKKYYIPHRIAYLIKNGPFDIGLCVCHTCDNKLCCNTDHLFLGTMRDNSLDHHNKVKNGYTYSKNCRFSREDVIKIYEMAIDGKTYVEIGKIFNVSNCVISDIVNNKRQYLKNILSTEERNQYLNKLKDIIRGGRSHNINIFGEVKSLRQWANDSRCVVGVETLRQRIKNGWDHEKSLITKAHRLKKPLPVLFLFNCLEDLKYFSLHYGVTISMFKVWIKQGRSYEWIENNIKDRMKSDFILYSLLDDKEIDKNLIEDTIQKNRERWIKTIGPIEEYEKYIERCIQKFS